MKIAIIFLVVLFAVLSVQSSSALPHPSNKLHKAVSAAGAGALLLKKFKPKIVAGGALVGGALLAKALLLKKPALIAGGLVAAKLAKKALVVGAGALVAKKVLGAIRAKKPCARNCCSRKRTVQSVHREVLTVQAPPVVREAESIRKKRSIIADIVSRGFERVSTGIENTGSRLSNFGDTLRRGGERLRDVSNDSRLAGGFISDTIRARANNYLKSLTNEN